jgi:hypothetical protein
LIEVNLLLRLVPRPFTATMIAIEMPAAIRPYSVGSVLIPAGTVVDSETTTLPMPPPIDAVALDDEAALAMAMAYEETNTIGGWHQLHFAPGIDRNAVLAQARHAK